MRLGRASGLHVLQPLAQSFNLRHQERNPVPGGGAILDGFRYGLEGAGTSEKGCSVKRAFVPPSVKRRPVVKPNRSIVVFVPVPLVWRNPIGCYRGGVRDRLRV